MRPIEANGKHGTYFQNKIKQDFSGHVSFDNELYEFYRTSELRANKIMRGHQNGTLIMQPTRNPLRAEKTPRKDFYGFNFNPPPIPDNLKKIERWNYEDDNTLKKSNSIPTKIPENKEVVDYRGGNDSVELSPQVTQPLPSVRSIITPIRAKVNVNLQELESSMLNSSISQFKEKVKKDPLLLSKWRAEQAAKYVSKNPLEPSMRTEEDRQVFLPTGFSSARRSYSKLPKGELVDKSKKPRVMPAVKPYEDSTTVLQNLNFLRSKLLETEHEIERQELKLALLNRTKHYEKPLTRS
jgi:hypothetical protein